MKLIYYSPAANGGLADYARAQANALVQLGTEVVFLASTAFSRQPEDRFSLRPELTADIPGRTRLSNQWNMVRRILHNQRQLVRVIEDGDFRHVLLGSYAEYLAPLWAGPLVRLAGKGTVFGAIVHDPVRDFVVGPRWWHRRSIAAGYSFLREAFVHEPTVLETMRPMPDLRTTFIPHAPYAFPPSNSTSENYRRELGIPPDAFVWLSFGHIRDGKNLDLAIGAMTRFPEVFLVVAGKEQSAGQKPASFYQDLARKLGVAERCIWLNRFIRTDEVGNLFEACDLVLLTYSSDFRSASGVLNAAVHFRKPSLASGGQGNLQSVVARYNLGLWIEPDREDALVDGYRRWKEAPPVPDWSAYIAENSWQRNAEIVLDRLSSPHDA